jgi:hypothetical protein
MKNLIIIPLYIYIMACELIDAMIDLFNRYVKGMEADAIPRHMAKAQ